MSSNGRRKPPHPRIEIVSTTTSESEATAVVAALEQFLADTAPGPDAAGAHASAWQRAALDEGVSARQVSGAAWGHSPARHGQTG